MCGHLIYYVTHGNDIIFVEKPYCRAPVRLCRFPTKLCVVGFVLFVPMRLSDRAEIYPPRHYKADAPMPFEDKLRLYHRVDPSLLPCIRTLYPSKNSLARPQKIMVYVVTMGNACRTDAAMDG